MEEEDLETQQKAAESIVTERRILESHNNSYIMSTCASFQDGKSLYLVLDFEGGESLTLCLNREGRFSEVRYNCELLFPLSLNQLSIFSNLLFL